MAKRRYTDEERAACLAALAANGGNVSRTAQQVGVPETTLRQWHNLQRHPEATLMSEKKKAPLANAFEDIARRCLEFVTDVKLEDASAVDLLRTAGIATDKMRLLRGESTQNVDAIILTLEQAVQADKELEAWKLQNRSPHPES